MTVGMSGSRSVRDARGRSVVALVLVGLLALPAIASARLQRVEAVGNYGIRESERSKIIPRDEAVQRALWESVSRVALEEMGEDAFDVEDDSATSEALRAALGDDMLPFTRRFKILQDKGESPVLFREDPEIPTEYVVVVEVLVDVDRVSNRGAGGGRARRGQPFFGEQGEPISVEFVGVGVDTAISRPCGGRSRQNWARAGSRPRGFAQNRQLVSVWGRYSPREVAAAIERLDLGGDDSRVEAIEVDEIGRRVRFRAALDALEPDGGESRRPFSPTEEIDTLNPKG